MTPDAFKVAHLLNRLASIAREYESHIAEMSVAHQLLIQEKDAEIARLQAILDDSAEQT